MRNNNLRVIKRKCITLVEVLVVIVILAILTVSLSAKIGSYFDKPKELRVLNDMSHVKDAVILVDGIKGIANFGELTDNKFADVATAETLCKHLNEYLDPSLKVQAHSSEDGKIEFIDSKDPWKNQYRIKLITKFAVSNGFIGGLELESSGPDGQYDKDDDDPSKDYDNIIMQILIKDGSLHVGAENLPGVSEPLVG